MKLQKLIHILIGIVCLGLAAHTAHAQKIGNVGYLKGPSGAGSVPVFTDRNALDAFYKANASNDREGIKELLNARRLFMVDAATEIRVLDSYGFFGSTMEVRILEGEFRNQRGFVSSQWVAGERAKQKYDLEAESRRVYAKWSAEWDEKQRRKAEAEAEAEASIRELEARIEASRANTPEDTKTLDEANRAINEFLKREGW